MTFENPVPVVVGLIPVVNDKLVGLVVVRRAIEPGKGMLALPGGFLEVEPWRHGLSREVREETGIEIGPENWYASTFVSSEPHPNRLLLFGESEDWLRIDGDHIPPFVPNDEVSEIGLVYVADEFLQDQIVFPLHWEQIREFLNGTSNDDDAPSGFHKLP
jgi:8-oxo-dGTP diphosphatase